MLGPSWKKHFTLQQFSPFYDHPSAFITCQWQKSKTEPNFKYFVYRTTLALLFLITSIVNIVRDTIPEKWAIFLTNWGYTVCTIQAILAVVMMSPSFVSPRYKFTQIVSKIYPAYWILNTIGTPLAFGITFMYWLVVYDAKTMVFDAMNFILHGNNSILMFIDLWMVSHPTRILHFIYPSIFGFFYSVFSVIYYAAGGTSRDGSKCIYKILDWDKPLQTFLICIGVTVFLIVLHFLVFSLHKARIALDEKCCTKKEDNASSDSELRKQAPYYVNEAMSTDIV